MKRLGLFVFYDKDNYVDDYVLYMLDDLKKNINDLIIICNCKLNNIEKSKLKKYTNKIILRENKGLDAGALYEYFNSTDEYKKYDELVYLNDTFFGPFYPFKTIFNKMKTRDNIDFWGLSLGHKQKYEGIDKNRKIIDEHIQTFFMVFKNKVLISDAFNNYWKNYDYKNMLYFNDIVDKHETFFTQYLVNNGFKFDSYIEDTLHSKDYKRNFNNYFYNPSYQIIKDNSPFIKRKMFSYSDGIMSLLSDNNELRISMNYIENKTNYDTSLIWKNLLRYYNLHTLSTSYGFNECISLSNNSHNVSGLILLNNSYFINDVKNIINYFNDTYIITFRNDIYKKCIKNNFNIKLINKNNTHFIKECISNIKSDYLCFLNLYENLENITLIDSTECQTIFDNILKSKEHLNGTIDIIENKNISMAYVPENNNYDKFYLNLFWKEKIYNYISNINTKYKLLNFNMPPVSFSTSFVVKKSVLNHLNFKKWSKMSFEDFIQVLAISLSYYGASDYQRPIIAYDKDYLIYKFNNFENIYKTTYRKLYTNNCLPATFYEVKETISNLKLQHTFKKTLYNYLLNHFYYPIRNRYRKLIKYLKRIIGG